MAAIVLVLGFFLVASPLTTSGDNDGGSQVPPVNPGDLPGVEEIPVVCPCIEFSPTVFDCSQHLLETRPDDVTELYEGMTPSMYLGDEDIGDTSAAPPASILPHQVDQSPSEESSLANLDHQNLGQKDTVAIDNGLASHRTIRSLDTTELTKDDPPNLNVYRRGRSHPVSDESLMGGGLSNYKAADLLRHERLPSDMKTVASKFLERILKNTHPSFDILKRLAVQFISANRGNAAPVSHLHHRGVTTSQMVKDEELFVNGAELEQVAMTDSNHHRKARKLLSVLATTEDDGKITFVNRPDAQKRAVSRLDTPELTKADPPIPDVYRRGSSETSSTEKGKIPRLTDENMSDSYEPEQDRRDDNFSPDPKTVASDFIERIVKDSYSTFDVLKRLTLQFINGKRGHSASTSDLQQRGKGFSELAGGKELSVTGGEVIPVPDLHHRRSSKNILSILTNKVAGHDNRGVLHKGANRSLDSSNDATILGAYRRGSSQSSSEQTVTGVIPSLRGTNVGGLYRPVDHPQDEKIPTNLKTIASKFIERLMRNTHSTFDVLRRLTLQFITGRKGRPASASNMVDDTAQLATGEPTGSGSGAKRVPTSHLNLHRNKRDIVHQTLTDTLPEYLIHSHNLHITVHHGERPLDGNEIAADNKENYPHHLVQQGHSSHIQATRKIVSNKERLTEVSRKSTSDDNKLRTGKQQKFTSQLQKPVNPKVFPGAVIPDCVPDNVETLYMGASRLGHVTNLTLSYLTKLVFLSLNDSGIVSISKDTFRNNNDLQELILDWNHISTLHASTLQNNPKLRVFSVMMTRLTTVDARLFDHNPQLESVAISNNLDSVPPTLFRHNPQLKHVDLHFNWLSDIPESVFFWSPKLESVDLSYNSIVELPESLFFISGQLRSANLSHNRIWSLPENTFSMTPLLEILKLDVNELSVLPPKTLAKLPALKELSLRANHLLHLKEETFSSNRQLRILDLGYNSIESLPGGIFGRLSNLRHLTLTGNHLTTLAPATFANNGKLANLNLDVNRISSLPQGLFDFTPELKSLHLESNELAFIDVDTFRKTAKLQELYLGTNKLRNLTDVLIAVDDCENLEKFSLLNNPWICECRNGQYVEVLRKFKTESLYCISSVGLVYDDFEEVLNEPECTQHLQVETDDKGMRLKVGSR